MSLNDSDPRSASARRFPFIFGTQYYRAPTPEQDCWEADLRNIKRMGFNAVKYFVQWRWSHRKKDKFFFEDLDRLMDMAGENGLGVTLNLILDVSPAWLFKVYPGARQVDNSGRVIEPYAVSHRQVGGHPGPCYNHPGALAERQKFVTAAIRHFGNHPALQMWDVWNEPELCFPQRTPDIRNMVCYCPYCRAGFLKWLKVKYADLEKLNSVWGRCYRSWEEVEMPRGTGTVIDFIDWREFHMDTMALEASWRLEKARKLDPKHGRYLHVVPNSFFSTVTCADDFAMAEECEVFAASSNANPVTCAHLISAGQGKVCYNVESHVNFGNTDMHQPVLGLRRLLKDFLPQVGLGIKGFMFWQYRSETLGLESPAWGIVKTDGASRPAAESVRKFWDVLGPYAAELREAFPAPAEIGLWRSRKNEMFHFCSRGQVDSFNSSIAAYIQSLYWDNLPARIINSGMLSSGNLGGIKLLIMPNCYYVTQEEAKALDKWVKAGGTLVCEAHLAGYNGTTGRHSRAVPGCGLSASWGIKETDSTSPFHLRLEEKQKLDTKALTDDVRKALKEFGTAGGEYFPIKMSSGKIILGAHRYAELEGSGLVSLGSFDGTSSCLAQKKAGKGTIFYCGTDLGNAAQRDPSGIKAILGMAVKASGIKATGDLVPELPGTVHLDVLSKAGDQKFAVMVSSAEKEQVVRFSAAGEWRGLFTGARWNLKGRNRVKVPADFAEIFVIKK